MLLDVADVDVDFAFDLIFIIIHNSFLKYIIQKYKQLLWAPHGPKPEVNEIIRK